MNAHNAIKQMQRFLGEQILSPVSPLRGEEPGERGLVAATPDASPQLPLRSEEGEQLARESIRAFKDAMATYRRLDESEKERLDPQFMSDGITQAILESPPESFTFFEMERLSRTDPDLALRRWEEVKAVARRDLESGWIAGRVVEPMGGNAWERACFLAIRDCLHRTWQPRHTGEVMLLDQLAQYEMLRLRWLEIAVQVPHGDATQVALQRCDSESDDKRIALTAKSLRESMRMVERLQRLSQNVLRMLLMLRRKQMPRMNATIGALNVAVGEQWNALVAGTVQEATPDVES